MKLCVLAAVLLPLWGQSPALVATMTTADVSNSAVRIPIASSAGIIAGMVCAVEREIYKVNSFDPPGTTGPRTMNVTREQGGFATGHLAGAPVVCGASDWFHTSDTAGTCKTGADVAWINSATGDSWQCAGEQWVRSGKETTCNAATRGKIVFTVGTPAGPITSDMLRVCAHAATGSYFWKTLF